MAQNEDVPLEQVPLEHPFDAFIVCGITCTEPVPHVLFQYPQEQRLSLEKMTSFCFPEGRAPIRFLNATSSPSPASTPQRTPDHSEESALPSALPLCSAQRDSPMRRTNTAPGTYTVSSDVKEAIFGQRYLSQSSSNFIFRLITPDHSQCLFGVCVYCDELVSVCSLRERALVPVFLPLSPASPRHILMRPRADATSIHTAWASSL